MIGLDTNVLVRYLAQDDTAQSALATRLAHAAGTVKAQNTVVLGAAAPLLPLPVAALDAVLAVTA